MLTARILASIDFATDLGLLYYERRHRPSPTRNVGIFSERGYLMTAVVAGTHTIIWYLRTIPPCEIFSIALDDKLDGVAAGIKAKLARNAK